ncbi:MAG: DUF2752 domain-containing protein [Phycisphaerales bacterium]|nr:DUF2752 domain-containing protein [Phycisphaerales bacterium]
MDMENPGERRSAKPVVHVLPTRGHPLGNYGTMVPLEHRLWGRVYAAGLAAIAMSLMVVAARLQPDKYFMGTHQQLRMPPCGFVTLTGLPCPTCGMTTAFAHAVRGHVLQAIRAQLAGFILALGVMLMAVFSLISIVTGRRPSLNWYRVRPESLLWWSLALLVAAWALKIVIGMCDGTLPVRLSVPHC